MLDIDILLANRYTAKLEWLDSWDALSSGDHKVSAPVTFTATVHDVINIQRYAERAYTPEVQVCEADLLQNFIFAHENVTATNIQLN